MCLLNAFELTRRATSSSQTTKMSYTDPDPNINTNPGASAGASAGQKVKYVSLSPSSHPRHVSHLPHSRHQRGAFQAAHGIGESIRGNAMDFIDSALGTERKGQPAFERGQQETAAGVDNMHGVGTGPNVSGTGTGAGTGMGQTHAVPPPVDQDVVGSDVKTQPAGVGAGAGAGMQGTAGVGSKSSAPGYGSQY